MRDEPSKGRGLIPGLFNYTIARTVLLPAEEERAFTPPMPEAEVEQAITTTVKQIADLKVRLNSALVERIKQINDWHADFSHDHSNVPGNYYYDLAAYLDNPDGSASLFIVSQSVNLRTIVDDLGSEEVSSLDDLYGESWVDWTELKRPILDRLHDRAVTEAGLSIVATPTDLAREWLRRGQPISVRTYDAEQLATIEQNIEPREGRSRLDFLMSKFGPRQKLVKYKGNHYSEPDDSSAKALDGLFVKIEEQEAEVYPLGEDVAVDDITQELINSGRSRAAFDAAETVTRGFEHGYLSRRLELLKFWKSNNIDNDKIPQVDEEITEIERRLTEIEAINGNNLVQVRGEMVLRAMRNDVAVRWDHGVVEGIVRNATGDHNLTHLVEFANLPGPLKLLTMVLGGEPAPYDMPNRYYLMQAETAGLLRSAHHIFGDNSDEIEGLVNGSQPKIVTE